MQLNGFQLVNVGIAPFVDITNTDGGTNVPNGTTSFPIVGTNSQFTVGDIWWSSTDGGSGGVPTSGTGWTFNASLATGPNLVTVSGSHDLGNVRSTYVTITVVPEPVAAGVAAVIGYSIFGIRRRRPFLANKISEAEQGGEGFLVRAGHALSRVHVMQM